MPTLVQLQQEIWWRNEFTPPTLQLLISKLRHFFQVADVNIGAKGDENHLRGYHRSRNWILNSAYCTNTTYSVSETPGNRSGGNGDWLCAIDITVPRERLIPMCQRLDEAVRSGTLEKVTEWYGNDDGDNRVDGYNNIRNVVATSDDSHLWHAHISIDRGHAGQPHDDLYAVLTGEEDMDTKQDALLYNASSIAAQKARLADTAPVKRSDGTFGDPLELQDIATLKQLALDMETVKVSVARIEQALTAGVVVPQEVSLTDAAVAQIAEAVIDEEKQRLEN